MIRSGGTGCTWYVALLARWEDSIAEVIYSDDCIGTAFLVLEKTLVTAQHVVRGLEDEDSNIWIRFNGTNKKWLCKVHTQHDSTNDVAILEIIDDNWKSTAQPIKINFAYSDLIQDDRQNWQTLAFPRGQNGGSLALSGYVASSQAHENGIRRIQLNYDQGNAKLLKHSSGSPVMHDGEAIGIVIKYNKNWPDTVLYAADISQSLKTLPRLAEIQSSQRERGENLSEELFKYLQRLRNKADALPYKDVLESLLCCSNWQPPKLTRVYVQAQYRSEYKSRFNTRGQSKSNSQRIEIEHVLSDYENLVLQGDPGSGKSSFVRNFAASSADRIIHEGACIDVPVLIDARDFVLLDGGSLEKRLYEYVTRSLRVDLNDDLFKRPPVKGRKWFILVDGVDEVVDYDKRLSLIEEINDHSMEDGGSKRFLVTSRPLADTSRFPSEHFGHYIVLPFSHSDTEDFAFKWFREVCEDGGAREASEFLEAVEDSSFPEISTVPAMLTISAIVFLSDRSSELPRDRIQLYQRYLDVVSSAAVHSDREKNLRKYLNDQEYGEVGIYFVGRLLSKQLSIFGDLAHHKQKSSSQKTNLDIAIEVIISRAEELNVPEDLRQPSKIRPIVQELLRGSGIFSWADDRYEFIHNTVREYILAQKLISECEPTEAGQWEITRRWSDARWREIVLFSIALWTVDAGLRDRMGSFLRRIASSGARGVHFAGVSIAEGARLNENDKDWIVDQLIDRARRWSACAELLSNFASPDPVEVLRLMPNHPRLRSALMEYVANGGNGCPESLYSLFDFASSIASPQELVDIAQSESAIWVRAGAALALCERDNQEAAIPLLMILAKSAHGQVGVDISKALAEKGCYEELTTICTDEDAGAVVRLAAGLFCQPDVQQEGVSRAVLDAAIEDIPSWNKVSDDVIIKLAEANRIDGLLSSESLAKNDRISICKKLTLNGFSDLAAVHLRALAADSSQTAQTRLDCATILVDCQEIEFLTHHLDTLSELGEEGAKEQLQVSRIRARLGSLDGLALILDDPEIPAVYRADAASSLAFHGQNALALDKIAELSKDQTLKDEDRRAYSEVLLRLGDPSSAIKCLLEAPEGSGVRFRGPLRTLVDLGQADGLMTLSKNTKLTNDDREYAVQGLGQLGRCDLLLELASNPDLSGVVRLEAIHQLVRLAWTEEAMAAATSLMESCSDPVLILKVLNEATKLGHVRDESRYFKFAANSPDADAGTFEQAVRNLIERGEHDVALLAGLNQISNKNSRPDAALSAARSFVSVPEFEGTLSWVHKQSGSPHFDIAIDYLCSRVTDFTQTDDDRRFAFWAIPEISTRVEERGVVDAILQSEWESALSASMVADQFAKLRRLDLAKKTYQSCMKAPRDLSYKTWLVDSMMKNGFGSMAKELLLADKEHYNEDSRIAHDQKWHYLSQLGMQTEAADYYRERLLEISRDGKSLKADIENTEPSAIADWLVALAAIDQSMVPLEMAVEFANCEKVDIEMRFRVLPSLIDLEAGPEIVEVLRHARRDRKLELSLRFKSSVLLYVLGEYEDLKESINWFFRRDDELDWDSLIQLLWVVREDSDRQYYFDAVLEYAVTRYDHSSKAVFTDYLYDHGFKDSAFYLLTHLHEVSVIVFAGKLVDQKEFSDAKKMLEMNSDRMLKSDHRVQFQNKMNDVISEMEGA